MEIKSCTSLMAEILRELRVEMNGAVVGAMEDRGLKYPLNYGVSLPTIRTIAKKYAPNHKLAKLLYQQQIRELQLAAIYVADSNSIVVDDSSFWSKGVVNSELAENVGTVLIAKSANCQEIADLWIASNSPYVVYSALIALSMAINSSAIDNPMAYIEKCKELATSSESILWRGIELVLVSIAKQGADSRKAVEDLLNEMFNLKLNASQYLNDEVLWQL